MLRNSGGPFCHIPPESDGLSTRRSDIAPVESKLRDLKIVCPETKRHGYSGRVTPLPHLLFRVGGRPLAGTGTEIPPRLRVPSPQSSSKSIKGNLNWAIFSLSRQRLRRYLGCWLTSGHYEPKRSGSALSSPSN